MPPESLADVPQTEFEAAADAVVSGDAASLERMLREHPGLIRARSARPHRATLLHYTAANGVEGERQRTPRNVVEIAEILLRQGADVDATALAYGHECTTLELAATSVHPERAGVQTALLQTLLDHGAMIERAGAAGHVRSTITACLANGRCSAARFLASQVAHLTLPEAAGVGDLDAVAQFFAPDKLLREKTAPTDIEQGLFYACQCGRNDVVEFLLSQGASVSASDRDGQTGLHWAAIGCQLETVRLLLARKAPLAMTNVYGGDPLGQALWSAEHSGDPGRYRPIIDELAAAQKR